MFIVIDGPALILLALLTANVRTCKLPSSKLRALDVFLAVAPHLTDEAKLDRMIPYVVELLQDDSPLVRSAAARTLLQIVGFTVPLIILDIDAVCSLCLSQSSPRRTHLYFQNTSSRLWGRCWVIRRYLCDAPMPNA
jgi:hypothetical protein